MIRNIKICKQCKKYYIMDGSLYKDKQILERYKVKIIHSCMFATSFDEDVEKYIPNECVYKMEYELLNQ